MNEEFSFDDALCSQNEDPLIGLQLIDSPSSVDSGLALSSPSSHDWSSQSSPCSPNLLDDELFGMEAVNENISVAAQNCDMPNQAESSTSLATCHESTPTKTKVNEKTIQKLLELLVTCKTAEERSIIANLLTTLLSHSLKKGEIVKVPDASVKRITLDDGQHRKGIKRPGSVYTGQAPQKQMKSQVQKSPPSIVLLEEPEQNYRARYESEGCRGPVHGSSEQTFPTFQIRGYNAPVWVTVYLATSNGTPHIHRLCGPGSTKLSCRNITLSNGVPAIQVLVGPETGMTAVLDCISLGRRRNFEVDKELQRRGLNPADWKSERKEACFIFTAEIPGNPKQTITCKSRVFQCTAPPGHPEIWWMRPESGLVTGGDEIGIIGKKFLKGFKVRFFGELPNVIVWATRVLVIVIFKTKYSRREEQRNVASLRGNS